jgi:S-adenosylmethionine hydrolase
MAGRIIALITDFGIAGHFAGVMKAVILGVAPDARILDITHAIPPQAIEEGAFVLGSVLPFLPHGSICVAVVDPGVGTDRRPIAIQTSRGLFVGPDNGLLSAALSDVGRGQSSVPSEARPVTVPSDCTAVSLTNARYVRQPVSSTFHGRDIFAPVAAHASLGIPLAEFGDPVERLLAFPPWQAVRAENGSLLGRVISVDSFGNLITDIRGADLSAGRVVVHIAGRKFSGLNRSYQDGPDFVVYLGSSGYLEIGRRNSNAAATLKVSTGAAVLAVPGRGQAGMEHGNLH